MYIYFINNCSPAIVVCVWRRWQGSQQIFEADYTEVHNSVLPSSNI